MKENKIKYAVQRAIRGFDDFELNNFSEVFFERTLKILQTKLTRNQSKNLWLVITAFENIQCKEFEIEKEAAKMTALVLFATNINNI